MEERKDNEVDNITAIYWKNQIRSAQTSREKFDERGRAINQTYKMAEYHNVKTNSNYNILYSNTETMLPIIYADKPLPDVRARDTKKISSRKGAELIEESLDFFLNDSFNRKGRQVCLDYLLSGIGQMRVKYKPLIAEDENEIVDIDGNVNENILFEELEFEYIPWDNFLYPDCGDWEDVPWVSFKSWITFEQAAEMFGEETASRLTYLSEEQQYKESTTMTKQSVMQDNGEGVRRACVYEIWDKEKRNQIFYSDNKLNGILEVNDDPLGLDGFFPVPKPLLSITTSDSLIPTAFYLQYQDLAIELDEVSTRIANLTNNMRRRGMYDAKYERLADLAVSKDNYFLPIKNFEDLAQKGGLEGIVAYEPVKPYADVLIVLRQRQQDIINSIYQIIGISDIVRAQTDPRETLGAQRMKSRYGTIRVSTYQRQVQEFFRDVMNIAGEIIVNQFQPESLTTITGKPLFTEFEKDVNGEPTAEIKEVGVNDLLDELRDAEPSDVVIDIQSDSTVLNEIDEEKKDLVDLTAALSQFVQVSSGLTEVIGLDATASLLLSYVEKYKLGRNVHQEILDHIDKLKEQANQPQEPQVTEEMVELQKAQINAQMEQAKMQQESIFKAAEIRLKQQELLLKAEELGIRSEIENDKVNLMAVETALKAEGLRAEAANPADNAIVGS